MLSEDSEYPEVIQDMGGLFATKKRERGCTFIFVQDHQCLGKSVAVGGFSLKINTYIKFSRSRLDVLYLYCALF